MMGVLLKIWALIVIIYLTSLVAVIYWPAMVDSITKGLNYLDQVSGGFATPALVVLLISGSIASVYVYSNIIVQTRKEPIALVIAGGTMFNNMFNSNAERRAREVLSEFKPPGNLNVVLFAPMQRDIGRRVKRVR